MDDAKFLGKAESSERKAKQRMRGKKTVAVKRDEQTPQGSERTTMLISLTVDQKEELQIRALKEKTSAAALVRDALIEVGYISPKA